MIPVEQLHHLFEYDAASGGLTHRTSKHKTKIGKAAGTVNAHGHLCVWAGSKLAYVHRIAWAMTYGEWPADCLDHMNGIQSDNRIANLRVVSKALNNQNVRAPRSNTKSRLLGVYSAGKRWRSAISVDKKQIHIGTFDTPEDAHAAYLVVKRKVHPACTL